MSKIPTSRFAILALSLAFASSAAFGWAIVSGAGSTRAGGGHTTSANGILWVGPMQGLGPQAIQGRAIAMATGCCAPVQIQSVVVTVYYRGAGREVIPLVDKATGRSLTTPIGFRRNGNRNPGFASASFYCPLASLRFRPRTGDRIVITVVAEGADGCTVTDETVYVF